MSELLFRFKKKYACLMLTASLFLAGCFFHSGVNSLLFSDPYYLPKISAAVKTFRKSDSRYSMNVHLQSGISQIQLKEIDSISLDGDKYLMIYEKSGLIKYGQSDIDSLSFSPISIPNRFKGCPEGTRFIESIERLPISEREAVIREEILRGNIPDLLRNMCRIKNYENDSLGRVHTVEIDVMYDYLSIGTDIDFVRIPMTPQTAQSIADAFGCSLPTRKIVNMIFENSRRHIEPVTIFPDGSKNELPSTFLKHNRDIEAKLSNLRIPRYVLVSGLKKDVVISNQLLQKTAKVAIYGWHGVTGIPIQPLYTGHANYYVDYSHGIRLVNSVIRIDGKETTIQKVLADPLLYKLISDEPGVMIQPRYIL
ncbi:MAG: hypothetical protein ACM3Q2_15000 [Syntrophothermus sp.]